MQVPKGRNFKGPVPVRDRHPPGDAQVLHGDAGLTSLIAVEANADLAAAGPSQRRKCRGGGLVRAVDGIAMLDVNRGLKAALDAASLKGQQPWRIAEALCAKISEACGDRCYGHA